MQIKITGRKLSVSRISTKNNNGLFKRRLN
jgi:hypothetical protein